MINIKTKRTTVLIQIHYITENNTKIMQQGLFPLRGKKPEQVAHEFWKWIKREMSVEIQIDKILCEDRDITESFRELEEVT